MCPIWFLNIGVKLLPFIMLNVKTESTKVNILSSQLLIFPCVSTNYMLVYNNGVKHQSQWGGVLMGQDKGWEMRVSILYSDSNCEDSVTLCSINN